MKSTTTKVILCIALFWLASLGVFVVLGNLARDIDYVAPDALHFIGFIALIPMISSVGGKLAIRKTAYIKKKALFKPLTISGFVISYLSLIPWILSFFIADNTALIYVDWAIVLTTITLSFVLFSLLLAIYLNE